LKGIKAMKKEIDEKEVWDRVVKAIRGRRVFSRIIRSMYGDWVEIRLSSLGLAVWPHASSNDLKFLNRVLARILREHGAIIRKSNGVRWVFIPLESIPMEKRESPKMKKLMERKRVMVEEVWVWSW